MCLFPWTASIDPDGGRPSADPEGSLKLPCGKCNECITLRATDWANRAKHEISLHAHNCFLTLTYDDEHLPSHLLVKDPFQRFLKRLREKTKKKLSYMVSHEYGSKFFRPHHHAIIFGYDPTDQQFLRTTKTGHSLFTSPEISSLWTEGFHSIGTANEKTAYYIASYALKGKEHEICLPNGEYATVSDCMDSSRQPGIGLKYFRKNYKQLIDSDTLLPRYYQKKLEHMSDPSHKLYDPDADNYLQTYQDKKTFFNSTLTPLQIRAKYKINQSKTLLTDTEFRSTPENSKSTKWLDRYIKNEVDFTASYNKKRKNT